jgi:hypothetical protein
MGLFRIHAAPFIGVVLYAPGNLRLYQVDAQLADFFRRDPAPGAPARSHGSQQFSFRQTPLCASSQTDRTASGGGHSRQRRLSADSAGGRALGGMTAPGRERQALCSRRGICSGLAAALGQDARTGPRVCIRCTCEITHSDRWKRTFAALRPPSRLLLYAPKAATRRKRHLQGRDHRLGRRTRPVRRCLRSR